MAITLQRLFTDCKRNYDIDIVAGHLGLKNLVRWVHIVEDSEVPTFLHGNELVFTTGIGIKSIKDFDFKAFAEGLIYHGSSGWVINIGPYIPKIPEDLIEFCNAKQFPLFTIPWKMRLIDVTYDYSHKIIENEETENSVAQAFNNLIFHTGNYEDSSNIIERAGYKKVDSFTSIYIQGTINGTKITSDVYSNFIYNISASINTINKYSMILLNDALVVIVSNANDVELLDLIKQIKKGIVNEYPSSLLTIGISDCALGYLELNKLYKQSHVASDTAIMMRRNIIKYDECGIYQLIYSIDDLEIQRRYVNDILGKIIEYDETNDTNYLEILKNYIEYNCSVQEISQVMGVHRNTINYKIKFIKTNFNLELDMMDSSKLWLAFCIKEILDNN